jgi:MFS family permease
MPCSAVVYFSSFYTRRQIAFRIGIFYASSITASAFGGLLAYGVFHIPDGRNLFTWSYLFLLEGSLTLITAIVAAFVLPKDLQTAYFLSEEEKTAGATLQLLDSVQQTSSEFKWSEALSEFRTLHFPVRAAIGFTFGVLLNSNANFLAIMTQRLGYSVVKTNLVCILIW